MTTADPHREVLAAILTAGVLAGSGKRFTAQGAVQTYCDVLDGLAERCAEAPAASAAPAPVLSDLRTVSWAD